MQKRKTSKRGSSTRYYRSLGAYLQEMRTRAGLTQRDVSISLGYSSAQFISNFERGIAAPPLKKLRVMMKLYRLPVDKVMELLLEGESDILRDALLAAPTNPIKATRRPRRRPEAPLV